MRECLKNILKILPSFWKLSNIPKNKDSVFYNSMKELNGLGLIREDFIVSVAANKRVIHFGFLDTPFCEEKMRSKALLHNKIKEVSDFLYGIDIDQKGLDVYRNFTKDYNNMILDVQQDINNFEVLSNNFDIILFPEVLEHIINPGKALANLRKICSLNNGSKLIVTVPNALSVHGFFSAIGGVESVHPDHYFYFSPHTIKKILTDSGFSKVEISLYSSSNLINSPGITKHGVIAVCET